MGKDWANSRRVRERAETKRNEKTQHNKNMLSLLQQHGEYRRFSAKSTPDQNHNIAYGLHLGCIKLYHAVSKNHNHQNLN